MHRLLVVVLFFCALAQAQATQPEVVFYPSGSLKIEGYVFKPEGKGPWPAIIYNHGSREGFEREERPFAYVPRIFVPSGYVVLVPERRGYGKSDGATFKDEVHGQRGDAYVSRLTEEADDVLAATDWLKQQPYVLKDRVAIVGWSLGGIMTVLATGRRSDYCAAVDQAAGALSWKSSPELQAKLKSSAKLIKVPLLSMVAENDAQTDAMKTIDSLVPAGTPHKGIVYPPFHPEIPVPGVAPGHMVFAMNGVDVWKADALGWINQYCAAK